MYKLIFNTKWSKKQCKSFCPLKYFTIFEIGKMEILYKFIYNFHYRHYIQMKYIKL